MLAIAAAFASRGAALEDPASAAKLGNAGDYHRKGMNDVGWNIWRGNYGYRLEQLAPSATSVGWWRVGPHSQRFGRFARGFHHASSRDAMSFALATTMLGGLPLAPAAATPVSLRVIWYGGAPNGTATNVSFGSFTLRYDSQHGCKTAESVEVKSSGVWEERTVAVGDAGFARGCGGGDLQLVNAGAMADVIFSTLEVNG